MQFAYNKLKGRIVEIYGTQAKFAKAMGFSEHTLTMKMQGNRCWNQRDIWKAVNLLSLDKEQIPAYFFTEKVQENDPLCVDAR